MKHEVGGWEEWILCSNPTCFCYSDVSKPAKRHWLGLGEHVNLPCHLLPSSSSLVSTPLRTSYPSKLPSSCWIVDKTESCYETASVDRFPVRLSSCLSVYFVCVCVWPCEGLRWGLNWAAVKHAGRSPQLWRLGFLFRKDKRQKRF